MLPGWLAHYAAAAELLRRAGLLDRVRVEPTIDAAVNGPRAISLRR
jgi:hypothetical protein